MRKELFLLTSLVMLSCKNTAERIPEAEKTTNNQELQALYSADQSDRKSDSINWLEIARRDSIREARVYELLDSGKIRTAQDYANAAMIFQHGGDSVAYGMAVKMMIEAVAMDTTINKWLLAAAIDRELMSRNEPQVYGTQYVKTSMDGPWKRYKIDTTKISDAERINFGVETLAEQREKVKRLNRKDLPELLSDGMSVAEVIRFIKSKDEKIAEYDTSERGINTFGYFLMAQDKDEQALEIFKLNMKLYPEAFNTYDSFGECLLKMGKTEKAILAYRKSLALNPGNRNAKRILTNLNQ